jgi:hypothetical protein
MLHGAVWSDAGRAIGRWAAVFVKRSVGERQVYRTLARG